MKKLVSYIIALSAASLFFACGDDTSSKNDSGLSIVGTASELPACEAANAGQLMFVSDVGAVFFCNATSWTNLSGSNGIDGINGTDGAGCIAVPNKDELGKAISYSVMCDGKLIGTLQNGDDGSSCTAEAVTGGYAIICDGVSVGILQHGTNGTSCTAVATTTGFDVMCADKLVGSLTNGAKGETGDGCSIVAKKNTLGYLTGEYTVTCGKSSVTLKDGLKGDDGENCVVADELDANNKKTGNYTLTCDGKTVTVKNGIDGTSCTAVPTTDKNGEEDGKGFVITCGDEEKGTILNGAKGDTGDGCSVEAVKDEDGKLTGEYSVVCGESSITLKDGLKGDDGENCVVADELDANNKKTGNYTLTCDGKTVTVKNGTDGASCTAVPTTDKNGVEDGKGFVIMCGDEEKGTILNGAKGDTGDGCSVEAVKDEDNNLTGEYTVTCGESVVTLKDGLKGDDGESCTVADELDEDNNKTGNYTLTCDGKTVTVKNGIDGTSCTAVPTTDEVSGIDGVIITCGTVQSTIWNGAKGEDGDDCSVSETEGGYNLKCGDSDPVFVKNGVDATVTDQSKQEILDWLTEYDVTSLSTCDEDNLNEIKDYPLTNRVGITARYWKCFVNDEVYSWEQSNQSDYEAYIASLTPDPDPGE